MRRKIEDFAINRLLAKQIPSLVPYSTARDEFSGSVSVSLDANESSAEPTILYSDVGDLFCALNRYPDPRQTELRSLVARRAGLSPQNIFIGNGSDEAIELLVRLFCNAGEDRVLILPPTYGMYAVAALSHGVAVQRIALDDQDFKPNLDALCEAAADESPAKILFLCSPNNPTGNSLPLEMLREILGMFHGIVVVDEAYVDFSAVPSATSLIADNQNLVVLQTFSKAWGLAALRVGVALASAEIIALLDRIKSPYNVNSLSQRLACRALLNPGYKEQNVQEVIGERSRLAALLGELSVVERVWPSDANFILIRVGDSREVYHALRERGILVRDRSNEPGCRSCLRLTLGTPRENDLLIAVLRSL